MTVNGESWLFCVALTLMWLALILIGYLISLAV
jgi:hypothetical protein